MLGIEGSYLCSTLLNGMIFYQNEISKIERESSTFEDEVLFEVSDDFLEVTAKNCFNAIERNNLTLKCESFYPQLVFCGT